MRLPLRTRFALLAAALVVLVASVVGLAGYLGFRASLLSRAAHSARGEASRLVGLVAPSGSGNGQIVDLTDNSLTRQLATPGVLVSVMRATGAVVQSTPGRDVAALLSPALRRACLVSGQAQTRRSHPPLTLACARVGPARAPVAAIVVAVPLQGSLASLSVLRRTLIIGVLSGAVLAALLSLLLARRALRPLKRIARTAETIRSGDLSHRIGYPGRDEVGEVGRVLDACFAELQEAVERERRFAADASHELKTPLAAIRANVELLRNWASSDPAARETALESLDNATRRASRLVASLLALVRAERQTQRSWATVRMDEVVLAAVREAAPLRPDVPIRIAELDDGMLEEGDPMGLHQVLLNVIENALEASPIGGEIGVSLVVNGAEARVTVSDMGPGIDPKDLERIFDRFYSRKPTRRSRAGTGLGLAIARAIAREHGGDLTARNNAGGGASFVLGLPLTAASPGGQTAGEEARVTQPAGGR